MHSVPIVLSFLAVMPLALIAQQPPAAIPAKAFLDSHDSIAVVDVAAMRTCGLLDELVGSALKAILPQIETQMGFPLEHLDRATLVVQNPRAGEQRNKPCRVVVLEGNRDLAIHDRITRGQYAEERVGGRPLWRHRNITWSVFAQPEPKLQVMGDDGGIVPVLEGKGGTAVPSPDVMSLLSTRGGSLVYAVAACTEASARKSFLEPLFPDTKWAEDEAPTHLLVRMHCTGGADDPHVELELVVRHRQPGGVTTTATALTANLERLRRHPQLRLLSTLLVKVRTSVDRSDLCATLDLGRMRDAVGQIATFAGAFLLTGEPVRAQPAAAVPAPAANPPQK